MGAAALRREREDRGEVGSTFARKGLSCFTPENKRNGLVFLACYAAITPVVPTVQAISDVASPGIRPHEGREETTTVSSW